MPKGKKTRVGIYHPPKSGMPYLVVVVSPEGVKAIACDSKHEARVLASSTAQKVPVDHLALRAKAVLCCRGTFIASAAAFS